MQSDKQIVFVDDSALRFSTGGKWHADEPAEFGSFVNRLNDNIMEIETNDTPHQGLAVPKPHEIMKSVSVNQQFKMFLVFERPDGVTSTLAVAAWSWSAVLRQNANKTALEFQQKSFPDAPDGTATNEAPLLLPSISEVDWVIIRPPGAPVGTTMADHYKQYFLKGK
ncbi:MAG: hypothetical protein HY719_00120 [Planctomycetes bacterium]|nr:hypothetical protein [Planctomycetota bacterium]